MHEDYRSSSDSSGHLATHHLTARIQVKQVQLNETGFHSTMPLTTKSCQVCVTCTPPQYLCTSMTGHPLWLLVNAISMWSTISLVVVDVNKQCMSGSSKLDWSRPWSYNSTSFLWITVGLPSHFCPLEPVHPYPLAVVVAVQYLFESKRNDWGLWKSEGWLNYWLWQLLQYPLVPQVHLWTWLQILPLVG